LRQSRFDSTDTVKSSTDTAKKFNRYGKKVQPIRQKVQPIRAVLAGLVKLRSSAERERERERESEVLKHPAPETINDKAVSTLLGILLRRERELKLTDAAFYHNFPVLLQYPWGEEEAYSISALVLSPSHGIVAIGTKDATPNQIKEFGNTAEIVRKAAFNLLKYVVQNKYLRNKNGPLVAWNTAIFRESIVGQTVHDLLQTKTITSEARLVDFFKSIERQAIEPATFEQLVSTIEGSVAQKPKVPRKIETAIASFDREQVMVYQHHTEPSYKEQTSVYQRRSNFCEMLTGFLKYEYDREGDTRLVCDLAAPELKSIRENLPLAPDEKPLIISFADDAEWSSWCLISDQNLFWKCEEESGKLNWDLIESVEVYNDGLGRVYDPYLEVYDRYENKFLIKTEKFGGREKIRRVLTQIAFQRKRAEGEE